MTSSCLQTQMEADRCFAFWCHQDIIRYKDFFIGHSPHGKGQLIFSRTRGCLSITLLSVLLFVCLIRCSVVIASGITVISSYSSVVQLNKIHYSDVKMSAMATQRCPTAVSWSFAQPFAQAQIKENTKATRHWPLWRKSRGVWRIPLTKGQ